MIDSKKAFNADPIVQKEVKNLVDKFNIKKIIETGTYKGETTKYFAELNNKINVKSVEINRAFYNNAVKNLGEFENIKLYYGDSSKILKNILLEINSVTANLNENVLFYLDAHWNTHFPLRGELELISKYCYNRSIIVIDDFYVPNRTHQYSYNNALASKRNIGPKAPNALDYGLISDAIPNMCDDYVYYYLNNTERVGFARDGAANKPWGVGKIYIFPKCMLKENDLKVEDFFAYEESIPFSLL